MWIKLNMIKIADLELKELSEKFLVKILYDTQ